MKKANQKSLKVKSNNLTTEKRVVDMHGLKAASLPKLTSRAGKLGIALEGFIASTHNRIETRDIRILEAAQIVLSNLEKYGIWEVRTRPG